MSGGMAGRGVQVRPLVEDDVPRIVGLYARYTPKIIDLERLQRSIGVLPGFVAEQDGRIAGFAYCYGFAPDILELANIHVAREWRDKRVGKELVDAIVQAAPDRTSAILAVNSLLNESTEEKRRPDGFYVANGFAIIFQNAVTSIYLRELRPGGR